MPLTITDDELRAMGMTGAEARVEIACRLFDAGKMSFGHAANLAGVSVDRMYDEIARRDIPRYRYSAEMLRQDVEAVARIGEREKAGGVQ